MNNIKRSILYTLFLTLMILTIGCAVYEPTNTATSIVPESTQAPLVTDVATLYPIATAIGSNEKPNDLYPVVTNTPLFSAEQRGPDFNIDEPVKAGAKKVTGTGPADVPIILVNVSFGGELLDECVIDKDGRFEFDLDSALIAGHSIGLQIGDLTGTDFTPSQFIYNENYLERPMVGILFDMVSVVE